MTPEGLVEEHIGLARKAARHIWHRRFEEFDDIYSDALLGLWDAARRYDESRGATFPTFAWPRMLGAIGDGRRERDFLSRAMRARGEIGAPVSLDADVLYADGLTLADLLPDPRDPIGDVDTAAEEWQTHFRLRSTIAALPTDDRYVVTRLLDGITLAEIGRELGFTESRACQISRRAFFRLRRALNPEAA